MEINGIPWKSTRIQSILSARLQKANLDHDVRGIATSRKKPKAKANSKSVGYDGALKKRREEDPGHFTDAAGNEYFDPGNRHYSSCHTALFQNTWNLNDEIIGDIVEALLGYQWLLTKSDIKPNGNFPNAFVTFMHDWHLAVFH